MENIPENVNNDYLGDRVMSDFYLLILICIYKFYLINLNFLDHISYINITNYV